VPTEKVTTNIVYGVERRICGSSVEFYAYRFNESTGVTLWSKALSKETVERLTASPASEFTSVDWQKEAPSCRFSKQVLGVTLQETKEEKEEVISNLDELLPTLAPSPYLSPSSSLRLSPSSSSGLSLVPSSRSAPLLSSAPSVAAKPIKSKSKNQPKGK
jgi:hypothetical protein